MKRLLLNFLLVGFIITYAALHTMYLIPMLIVDGIFVLAKVIADILFRYVYKNTPTDATSCTYGRKPEKK